MPLDAMNMTVLDLSELLSQFETRREHCRYLLDLTRRQSEAIDANDFVRLLETLGKKTRVLKQLDAWDVRHSQAKAQWKALRTGADPGLRDDCEHVLAETQALLAEMLELEKQTSESLAVQQRAAAADRRPSPRSTKSRAA